MLNKRTLWGAVTALFAALLLISALPLAAQSPTWTADYYNNATLAGTPALTRTDASIAFDWGTNAPADGVNADNFSVRWGADVTLTAGTYRFTARADDNVRVIFNYNTILIDTFDQNLVGAEIIADYTVPANGTYHIQVDYRELSNSAFANVSLASLSGGVISPTTTPALTTTAALPPTDVTAVVTAGRLNVRNAPQTGTILTTVNRNQSFPVVATNSDSSWYLLNVGDTQGWVSATFVTLNPADATVPIAGSGDVTTTPVPSTGELTATADPFTVNIRSGPSVEDERLGRLVSGQSAPIIGRTADNQWWQIEANGVTGWVSAQFAVITQGADVNSIPVTDTGTPAAEATDSP